MNLDSSDKLDLDVCVTLTKRLLIPLLICIFG